MRSGPKDLGTLASRRSLAPVLILVCLVSSCRLVGGDGGDRLAEEREEDAPAIAPAARLGSVALTADCDSDGKGTVQALRLTGDYDCDRGFTVKTRNVASGASGALQMRLVLEEIDAEGPEVGPTPTPHRPFSLATVETPGGTCEVGRVTAVCRLDSLPPGGRVAVVLGIDPAPREGTVTTEVELFEG